MSPLNSFLRDILDESRINACEIRPDNARVHELSHSERSLGQLSNTSMPRQSGASRWDTNGGGEGHLAKAIPPLKSFFSKILGGSNIQSFDIRPDNAKVPTPSQRIFALDQNCRSTRNNDLCLPTPHRLGESRWDPYEGEKGIPFQMKPDVQRTRSLVKLVAKHVAPFLSKELGRKDDIVLSTVDVLDEALDVCADDNFH
jgi:hypothetical protein